MTDMQWILFLLLVSFQEPQVVAPEGHPFTFFAQPALPEIELTLAEVIDITSEYDIRFEDSSAFCDKYYGLTSPKDKTITICSRIDLTLRRWTILHEFFHILYWRKSIQTSGPFEPEIDALAWKALEKLYGIKIPETPIQAQEAQQVPQ